MFRLLVSFKIPRRGGGICTEITVMQRTLVLGLAVSAQVALGGSHVVAVFTRMRFHLGLPGHLHFHGLGPGKLWFNILLLCTAVWHGKSVNGVGKSGAFLVLKYLVVEGEVFAQDILGRCNGLTVITGIFCTLTELTVW